MYVNVQSPEHYDVRIKWEVKVRKC